MLFERPKLWRQQHWFLHNDQKPNGTHTPSTELAGRKNLRGIAGGLKSIYYRQLSRVHLFISETWQRCVDTNRIFIGISTLEFQDSIP